MGRTTTLYYYCIRLNMEEKLQDILIVTLLCW